MIHILFYPLEICIYMNEPKEDKNIVSSL